MTTRFAQFFQLQQYLRYPKRGAMEVAPAVLAPTTALREGGREQPVETRLRAGRSAVRTSTRERDFDLLRFVQTDPGGPPILLFNGYLGSFPGANHSPPSSGEVKISGVTPPLPLCACMEWTETAVPFRFTTQRCNHRQH
jgi:hypothetical protein